MVPQLAARDLGRRGGGCSVPPTPQDSDHSWVTEISCALHLSSLTIIVWLQSKYCITDQVAQLRINTEGNHLKVCLKGKLTLRCPRVTTRVQIHHVFYVGVFVTILVLIFSIIKILLRVLTTWHHSYLNVNIYTLKMDLERLIFLKKIG